MQRNRDVQVMMMTMMGLVGRVDENGGIELFVRELMLIQPAR